MTYPIYWRTILLKIASVWHPCPLVLHGHFGYFQYCLALFDHLRRFCLTAGHFVGIKRPFEEKNAATQAESIHLYSGDVRNLKPGGNEKKILLSARNQNSAANLVFSFHSNFHGMVSYEGFFISLDG